MAGSAGRVRAAWRRRARLVARVLAHHLEGRRVVEVVFSRRSESSDGGVDGGGETEAGGARGRACVIELDVLEGVVCGGGVEAVPRVRPRRWGWGRHCGEVVWAVVVVV